MRKALMFCDKLFASSRQRRAAEGGGGRRALISVIAEVMSTWYGSAAFVAWMYCAHPVASLRLRTQ